MCHAIASHCLLETGYHHIHTGQYLPLYCPFMLWFYTTIVEEGNNNKFFIIECFCLGKHFFWALLGFETNTASKRFCPYWVRKGVRISAQVILNSISLSKFPAFFPEYECIFLHAYACTNICVSLYIHYFNDISNCYCQLWPLKAFSFNLISFPYAHTIYFDGS